MAKTTLCHGKLTLISTRVFEDKRGALTPMDFAELGFQTVRAFLVNAPAGSVRGGHAHSKGRQILMLASGQVAVEVFYRDCAERVTLDSRHRVLLVEPGVWMSQTYLSDDSALVVFCDTAYDPDDYIYEKERVFWATLEHPSAYQPAVPGQLTSLNIADE